MARVSRTAAVAIVVAVSLATALGPTSAHAAGWGVRTTIDPPGLTQTALTGVSCTGPGACVAVGDGDSGMTSSGVPDHEQAVAEAWMGLAWGQQTPVNPASDTPSLGSVSCVSATFCFAVGATRTVQSLIPAYGSDTGSATIAELWDGRSWMVEPTPRTDGSAALTGVSCASPDLCVAVGTATAGRRPKAITDIWNGRSWWPARTPQAGNDGATLTGVSCVAANACTAVGSYFVNVKPFGTEYALAERWNGHRWIVQRATHGSLFTVLEGVSCASRSACVAVGYQTVTQGVDFVSPPWAEKWNGRRWSSVRTGLPSWTQLYGVSCGSSADCVAVGRVIVGRQPVEPGKTQPIVGRLRGSRWIRQRTPHIAFAAGLAGVSCLPAGGCMAVGTRTPGSLSGYTRTLAESDA